MLQCKGAGAWLTKSYLFNKLFGVEQAHIFCFNVYTKYKLHFMEVLRMTMESAKRILALLPGVDCGGFGGCGCPTCEACAQAIAEGAPITLCPAAVTVTVAKIA